MKKIVFLSLFITTSVFSFSQQTAKLPAASKTEFTKAELLAFSDVKALLTAITKKDYSNYMVRNFSLTTMDGSSKLSESGPGGTWSEKQKAMIEKHAKKGNVFTLENIMLFEKTNKGAVKVEQPNISFSIKE